MVKLWEQGADIVYGQRKKREGETFLKKFTAACYYRLLTAMSAYPIPLDTGDFRLIGRNVADVFLRMREHDRFLRGMSAWMGFEAVPLEYVRQERAAGKTKYTLKKMLKLALDGITGFSTKPLTMPMIFGGAVTGLALLGFLTVLICACTVGAAAWLWALCGVVLPVRRGAAARRHSAVYGRPGSVYGPHLRGVQEAAAVHRGGEAECG